MAEHSADIPGTDYAEHERTFEGFVSLTKLGVLAILTTLVSILVITFTGSGFFKLVGFVLIPIAYIVAFAELKLRASGYVSFALLVVTLALLIVAVS